MTDRAEALERLAIAHFSDEAVAAVIAPDAGVEGFTGRMLPHVGDFPSRDAFDIRLGDLTFGFMEKLRAAGFCAPCQNNGPREVASLHAWNAWLDGVFDPQEGQPPVEESFEAAILWQKLLDSPAFATIRGAVFRAAVRTTTRLRAEQDPDAEVAGPDEQIFYSMKDIEDTCRAIREVVASSFAAEADIAYSRFDDSLRSDADATRYVLAGSFLQPALALPPKDWNERPAPLPPLTEPAYVRHMEIPMPSGVLVMSDWFRVEGFKEGLNALGAGDYSINESAGLDARARDYFEKAGIAIVQVGNTSPTAMCETPGIWRMGFFDEDHDAFWTEEGAPREPEDGTPRPDTPWSTCTDLWANTFADRETVISVLQASGLYEDRAAAGAALDAYVASNRGSVAIDLSAELEDGVLHLYAPTGPGIHKENFAEVFAAEETPARDWIEDMYVLSARPLSVDPEILEEEQWQAPAPLTRVVEEGLEL